MLVWLDINGTGQAVDVLSAEMADGKIAVKFNESSPYFQAWDKEKFEYARTLAKKKSEEVSALTFTR